MRRPRPELDDFLGRAYPGAAVSEVGGDASARQYWRLALPDGSTRVVMDYGAPFEGETADLSLSRIFRRAGLRVADIFDAAPAVGCLIVEDLGDATLESLTLDPGREPGDAKRLERLYERATDLAVAVAVRGTPALEKSDRAAGPALDAERFRFEMDFFVEHYVGAVVGVERPGSKLALALRSLADAAAEGPRVFCHRDYHSRNLMVLSNGALAMVDIQDARWGPLTYDLASLLRDAYADLDESLVDRLLERYRRQLPAPPSPQELRDGFDLVAAQRMVKMLGTFGYQTRALGRTRYLDATARTLMRLEGLLPFCPATSDLFEAFVETGLLPAPSAG